MGLASLVGSLYVGRYAGESAASGWIMPRDEIWSRLDYILVYAARSFNLSLKLSRNFSFLEMPF